MTEDTVDMLVQRYVELRDNKAKLKKEMETAISSIDDLLKQMEGVLLEKMNSLGAESVRTKAGTVYKSTAMYASVSDWEALLRFVREHDHWQFLQRAVNRKEVREFMEEENVDVPGVRIRREVEVNVRR